MAEFIGTEEKVIDVDEPVIFENKKVAEWKERMMPKFDPLRFIADHAGLSLADAISESYRQGQQDAQHIFGTNDGDTISRQAAIDEICDIRCGKSRFDCESYKNRNYISDCDYIRSLLNLPSTQPKIIRCEDCKHLQKWRSEESAKKFGQIYECARNVLNCPKSEDFCSCAERREE